MMSKFNVRRFDNRNWVLEEWIEGGINPKTREKVDAHWSIIGYYGQLKDLVKHLLDKSIILPDNATGQDILKAIKEAERNILKQLEAKNG